MIHLFNNQNKLKHVRRNIIFLHLVLLPVFNRAFGIKIKVCKDKCGDYQLKLIFGNLLIIFTDKKVSRN